MNDEPLDGPEMSAALRAELHFRRLGTRTPRCTPPECDERDPAAFTGVYPDNVCYEHEHVMRGISEWEGQHPPGKSNDAVTISTRGNDHRVWDDAKRDWPERTLHNPDGSPLLKAAAAVRSVLDWLRLLANRLLAWIPPFLERLDEVLRGLYGDRWWTRLGLESG